MSRRRWLSTDISKDARVRRLAADCGEFAALVYSWAIPHAADDGSLPADPDELLMLVTPGFRWRTPEDMQAAIDGMLKLGLLERQADKLTFPPAAFYKYQTYVTALRRESTQNSAEQRETTPSSSLGASALNAHARPRRAGRAAQVESTEQPTALRPTQEQCPLCPEVFADTAALREHLDNAPRHKVRPQPETFGRSSSAPLTGEIEAELAAMATRPAFDPENLPPEIRAEHERYLARARSFEDDSS